MSPQPYTIIMNEDGERTLTVFPTDSSPVAVAGDSPAYDECLALAEQGAPGQQIAEAADAAIAISRTFAPITGRVAVNGGEVYLDGEPMHGALVDHILRTLDEGGNVLPLARFYERLSANPNAHSREQLYGFLAAHDFTITQEGQLIGYKGVAKDGQGDLVSVHSGQAVVDGKPVDGQVPNYVGAEVSMPRESVQHDPSNACSRGLHVGTYAYAGSWARGAMLKVVVDPADVVSVPDDASGQKVRVSRYRVLDVIDAPVSAAVEYDRECECGMLLASECLCELDEF